MTTPLQIHRIADRQPEFPCWAYAPRGTIAHEAGWYSLVGDALNRTYYNYFTHWCHSAECPTVVPEQEPTLTVAMGLDGRPLAGSSQSFPAPQQDGSGAGPTPRTDASAQEFQSSYGILVGCYTEHARTLERELAAMHSRAVEAESKLATLRLQLAEKERDAERFAQERDAIADHEHQLVAQLRTELEQARQDKEIVDYLASMWDSQGRGHHVCGRFLPNVNGSFRSAARAHKALRDAATKGETR